MTQRNPRGFLALLGALLLVILFIGGCSRKIEEPVTLKTALDKKKITIGDRLTFTFHIEYNRRIKVTLPDIASGLSAFEIKDYKIEGPKTTLGRKVILIHKYVVSTFTTGTYEIPAFVVLYEDENGRKMQVTSPKLSVFVEGVKPGPQDKDDIRDIKPPVGIPHSFLFWILVTILPLLAVASFTGYWYYTRHKKKDFFAEEGPPRPPEEVALQRLEKLLTMNFIEEGKIKEFHIMLSEIIRRYLQERYNLPILERTTLEACQELKKVDEITKKNILVVRDFLEECDLVKFAKHLPPKEICEKNYSAAKEIVETTRPQRKDDMAISA